MQPHNCPDHLQLRGRPTVCLSVCPSACLPDSTLRHSDYRTRRRLADSFYPNGAPAAGAGEQRAVHPNAVQPEGPAAAHRHVRRRQSDERYIGKSHVVGLGALCGTSVSQSVGQSVSQSVGQAGRQGMLSAWMTIPVSNFSREIESLLPSHQLPTSCLDQLSESVNSVAARPICVATWAIYP
jgi:hypothetical protein